MQVINKFSRIFFVVVKKQGLRQCDMVPLAGFDKMTVSRLCQAGERCGFFVVKDGRYFPSPEIAGSVG